MTCGKGDAIGINAFDNFARRILRIYHRDKEKFWRAVLAPFLSDHISLFAWLRHLQVDIGLLSAFRGLDAEARQVMRDFGAPLGFDIAAWPSNRPQYFKDAYPIYAFLAVWMDEVGLHDLVAQFGDILRAGVWIVRDHETDDAALRWIDRLAATSRAAVTLLPVVPWLPRLYRRGDTAQFPLDIFERDVDSLLPSYVRWLNRKNIEGTVSRRQGDPLGQIHNEVRSGTYDLIVVAAESHNGWERLFLGEVVAPLLRWGDRPVLVAR